MTKPIKDDMSIVNMTSISSRDTIGVKFLSAGIAACIADFITFPLDTAKVRLQIQGEKFQTPSLVNNVSHINQKPLNSTNIRQIYTMAINAPYNNQLLNKSAIKTLVYAHKNSSSTASNYQPKGLASRNVQSLVLGNLEKNLLPEKLSKTQFTPIQSSQVYKGLIGTIFTIAKQEGPVALYNGLVAGLHRQMSFASIRIGLYDSVRGQYETLFNSFTRVHVFKDNVGLRIMAGITTGGLAVCLAQPADVVKVRLQAQIKSQTSAQQRYKGAMDAYKTICKKEGLKGLWRGIMPNMARNSVINACELVGYDIFKQYILRRKLLSDNVGCHFFAAFGAGFITTIIASPIDVVKTRFMNAPQGHYKGSLQCAYLMITKEGPKSFYKGFTPSFVRLASWNVIMFVCYEQLKRQFVKLKQ